MLMKKSLSVLIALVSLSLETARADFVSGFLSQGRDTVSVLPQPQLVVEDQKQNLPVTESGINFNTDGPISYGGDSVTVFNDVHIGYDAHTAGVFIPGGDTFSISGPPNAPGSNTMTGNFQVVWDHQGI